MLNRFKQYAIAKAPIKCVQTLHISQLEVDLRIQVRPLVTNKLTLQLLLRERLQLLLGYVVQVHFVQAFSDRLGDRFIRWALRLEARKA